MASGEHDIFRFFIDALWCDVEGVCVRGWAYGVRSPLSRLSLRCGDQVGDAGAFTSRADVRRVFPDAPDACGFTCYLACPPFREVVIEVETESGERCSRTLEPTVPSAVPEAAGAILPDAALDRFVAAMTERRGRVIEIGARSVSPGATSLAARFSRCEFIGVDIHPAPGVDLVTDAHALSESIAPGSVDGVFSLAVVEHLAAPWVVAAEINRVLRIGGLTYHLLPQSWPVHEMPNDFWRMTDEALKVLFGPATGFEVVEAGMGTPVQMILHPTCRYGPFLEVPFGRGMSSAHILARKVRDLAPNAVRWPSTRSALQQQASAYPVRGP